MTEMRRCVGSARFGIEAHEAPIADFPKQPSQKDGLGRMCTTHWREYVKGLARGAKARVDAAQPTAEEAPAAKAATPAATAATKETRTAKAAPPEKVAKAKALIDTIDALPGPKHVAGIATDKAQEAPEVLAAEAASA
ncbi:MAG: hypothetical protein ACRDMH_13090 [Solirubrobacterales bacterium]